MRLAALALLLPGCAAALVDHGQVTGFALGHARIDVCDPGAMGTVGGAFVGSCVRIVGGDLSTTFAGMLSALGALALSYFTMGAF